MSDLKAVEKLKIEKLFGMESGYVLNFSNKTFQNFVLDNTGIDLYEDDRKFMVEQFSELAGVDEEQVPQFTRV